MKIHLVSKRRYSLELNLLWVILSKKKMWLLLWWFNMIFVCDCESSPRSHFWLLSLRSVDAGSFGLGELLVSHWCCITGNAFFSLKYTVSNSGWNMKSLCILTALAVFLNKMMGKSNHTGSQIFRSSYLSSNW